jgi:hypothetical protein
MGDFPIGNNPIDGAYSSSFVLGWMSESAIGLLTVYLSANLFQLKVLSSWKKHSLGCLSLLAIHYYTLKFGISY